MPANPLSDTFDFLIGNTGDYLALGLYRFIPVVLFAGLLVASVAIARLNWIRDPAQRTGRHVSIWLMRACAAGLWFQGSIWKLPLPVSGGFMHWTAELATGSALPFEPALVNNVFLPNLALIQPLVYALEVFLAVSLLLGFAVRLSGILAALFTAHLWLGLYNTPGEWSWTYGAIIFAHGMFAATEAGRSLGLDNLLRGEWSAVFRGRTPLLRAYLLAS